MPPCKLTSLLHQLGLTPKYNGYHSILAAVSLIREDPQRMTAVIKDIYMAIGRTDNRHWYTVERNIRYAISNIWTQNREVLQKLSQYPLLSPPTNSEFLWMLYYVTADEDAP